MIAIVGALDGEIAEFLAVLENKKEEKWTDFTFYMGKIEDKDVIVTKCGVGKVMAALVAQRLIDTCKPEAFIFTGLAGGLSANLEIGDTLVAEDCMQHDMNAISLGFKRGEIPYSPYRILPCDRALVDLAMQYVPEAGKVVKGRILTGDQFITNRSLKSLQYLYDDLAGDAVEMEGAAIGLVATVNKIPFLLVRIISDRADTYAHIDFQSFLPKASRNSLQFIRHILRGMV
ncbi:MAG: 5'-methylthioadenosine/adenosylhomocysteine nucleosidase [Spirochaetales bacterium]|jgi:adenosylhomocysteine nucleosidase/adenosylhomocysteine/aminodeoxyfutalosine nucleosidase|nr:5'-methylthioadenosine/adenosylhomocysteine nucleosidase [Spirochaetales bacterium]